MGEGGDRSELLDSEGIVLELGQEKQMKEVLELSVFEMKNTVAELEKRLNSVEDEDNEWKTRYETQIELNRQIERQIGLLQGKMDHVRSSPTDRLASVRSFDQMHMAYHKANDERRAYLAVISQISGSLNPIERQKMDAAEMKRENHLLRGRCNIPRNQRILDPKKGPIKKTAGVKHLPKLKL
ncbi:coiled-coil domain-containing protein 169 isoform X2 [Elgaria multicarinata webbii]|uniref:coiled-coil domain-containing protein 169 isoform X2 n=1 Tax=Elgaria multicarinata webbii TaxID=159646 RepID=UPI002FCCE085